MATAHDAKPEPVSAASPTPAQKHPLEAWKAILQLLMGVVPVVLFLFGGVPDLGQDSGRCFVAAQRLLQESLDCRAFKGQHPADWPDDATGHEQIVKKLDEACDPFYPKAYPPIGVFGDESLLLSAGRIHAGVERWKAVIDDLEILRSVVAWSLLGGFVLSGLWILANVQRPGDVLDELASKIPTLVRAAFNVVFSLPVLLLVAMFAVVVFVEYVDLRHSAVVVERDLEHRYLLGRLVPPHSSADVTSTPEAPEAPSDTPTPPN